MFGILGGALERGWPAASNPAAVAAFLQQHRLAVLGQSAAFVLSAAAYVWFFSAMRVVLAHAEGADSDGAATVFGGGLVWVALQFTAQAMQVGIATAPVDAISPATLWIATAVFALANLPLGVALFAVAYVTFRTNVFPRWLGALALLAAFGQIVLAASAVVQSGPLAADGWLLYVLYPLVLVWLVPTIAVSWRRGRPR